MKLKTGELELDLETGNANINGSLTASVTDFSTGTRTGISTNTANYNTWGSSERVDVVETEDSIEFIYKETSMITLTSYPPLPPEERVFKIVFSCVDGKWNKSDRIYGEIVKQSDEIYTFY
jgi:hypothetical protein